LELGVEHATLLASRLERVHARFHEALPLAQVARRAGLSPSAFSRFFRRRTGKTFQAHLLELRLAEVKRRLAGDAEATVAETAFACGFNNLSNFNRLFRRGAGASPREWRRRLGS
jgi:AraC-like DNA-binding protein